ncbi:MAG TPA: hypothetical protein VEE85_01305 [Candidatus Bathyarchaeia archaeon]|nr:hypothetical protein [Candidatus Bathyarchaeia archaeon]
MCRRAFFLLAAVAFALQAFGAPDQAPIAAAQVVRKINRKDSAFATGYKYGYRQGARSSAALSSSYNDQSGPVYEEAIAGYTPQYGDRALYQKLFRCGYIAGYKAGWDFNSGLYNPLGAGSW